MPSSTRKTLLSPRTGPGNTSWGSVEVERSAPGAEKSHVLGGDVWAAALPKTSRHLQKVPGCKTARVHSLCSIGYSILHHTGRGWGKLTISSHSMLWNITSWLKITIWIEALISIHSRNSTKYSIMSANVREKMQ